MIKIPVNIPHYKRSKRNGKSDPNKWYIYKTKIMVAALFYKTAGGVGRVILDYLLWQRSMNGVESTTLPNKFFYVNFGITRQTKYNALMKLEKEKLVVLEQEDGKATLVKLNITEQQNG
jgi:hypothetical protein|tara:strand:+ start:3884 stop:4240 length:357 start_codon:yes stop_codon:yes gene_type:complete